MKGSLNIQVTYDTTRSPSGDHRYDFVTKVSGDPILDQLSLAERQAFDLGIAGHVNEMLAGTHRILVPKEKWLFEDVAIVLFYLGQLYFRRYLEYTNWREMIITEVGLEKVWTNIEASVYESMGDEFAQLVKFPDAKIKYVSDKYLREIVETQLRKSYDCYPANITSVDKAIVLLRKQLEITPETLTHGYSRDIVRGLLKETYSFTDDELTYILNIYGPNASPLYTVNPDYFQEQAIKIIAHRAMIDGDVFLSQVIATSRVLETAGHERDKQQ